MNFEKKDDKKEIQELEEILKNSGNNSEELLETFRKFMTVRYSIKDAIVSANNKTHRQNEELQSLFGAPNINKTLQMIARDFSKVGNYQGSLNLYIIIRNTTNKDDHNNNRPIYLLTDKTIKDYFYGMSDDEIIERYPTYEQQLNYIKKEILIELHEAYFQSYLSGDIEYLALSTKHEYSNDDYVNDSISWCTLEPNERFIYSIGCETLPEFIIKVNKIKTIDLINNVEIVDIKQTCISFLERFNRFKQIWEIETDDVFNEEEDYYFPQKLPVLSQDCEINMEKIKSKLHNIDEKNNLPRIEEIANLYELKIYRD